MKKSVPYQNVFAGIEYKEYMAQKMNTQVIPFETMSHKKRHGQYFTICEELQQFVFDKVKHKGEPLLEPSFGAGHLLRKFKHYDPNYPMTCYEIDQHIEPIVDFNRFQTVAYGDFLAQTQATNTKYKTIVGNPPYVKHTTGNLYIKFIERCYSLLDDRGEIVFIVPSDFIKATTASSIISEMERNGSFTDFLFPNNERLFDGASVDVVVFRYEKGLHTNKTNMNGKEMFCNVRNGIITFSEQPLSGRSVSELFDVFVGLVSGRDEIYRRPFGNIDVLCDEGRVERYIFTSTFPCDHPEINDHLLAHKTDLLQRKIRTFTEQNWFEWGAPRNISSMQEHSGKPCIYVKNITRNKRIAFVANVQYFGGGLLCLIPKEPQTLDQLHAIAEYFNSDTFQKDYMYAGRFKIGHKQISNAVIPCIL